VQAITIILLYLGRQLRESKTARVVVVMPANVLANWMAEAARWLRHFSCCNIIEDEVGIRMVLALLTLTLSCAVHTSFITIPMS
jgi:SNF2 family DNA or RNA helicase